METSTFGFDDFGKKWGIKQLAIFLHQMRKAGMETKFF
jgi:hypothetical protein